MTASDLAALELSGPLLLVGGGKMGGAMLAGWLAHGLAGEKVTIIDPDPSAPERLAETGVHVVGGAEALAEDLRPAVIVMAVKPQVMDAVLPAYNRFASGDCVFLSIAAGRTIASFEAHLGAHAAVVRAMPNTPAAVRRGMSVLIANDAVTESQAALCEALLGAVGRAAWAETEDQLDAVTAVSGSGPAYVFYLVEALAEAARAVGLPSDLAEVLARETVVGAGELMHQADESAGQLRKNVTSPGGTTQAALEVLMADDGLRPVVTKAVEAATKRSRELDA